MSEHQKQPSMEFSMESEEESPEMEVSMEHLPPELLMHLFTFLDGLSLIRISCTCKKFLDVASLVWQPVFKRELEDSVLDVAPGIHKGLHRPHIFHSSTVPWKKLYRSVYIWQSLPKWNVVVTLSNLLDDDEITCFGMAGHEALLGTTHGFVLKVNKNDLSPSFISEHESKVKSLVLQVSSENDYEDKILRHRVITLSVDKCLKVNDLDCGHSMTAFTLLENVVGHQDILYEWSEKSNYVYDLKFDIHREILSRVCLSMQLPSPSLHGRVIAIDPHQNMIITHRSGPMTWEETSRTWTAITPYKSRRVLCGYIFYDKISVSITTDHNMIITVKSQFTFIEWPVMMKPTSALLHGQVFIVGTSSGNLFFFFLKSRNDIQNISPFNSDAKFHTNQSCSILHLGVSESSPNYPFPTVYAATRQRVIMVQPTKQKISVAEL